MNASELITEVRELLDEPVSNSATTPYFTDARLLAWLNQVYIQFCRFTNWHVRKTNYLQGSTYMNAAATTASSPIHNMPSDFLKLDPKSGVFWVVNSKPRKLDEMDKVQAALEGWWRSVNVAGTPSHYSIRYLDADLKGITAPAPAPTLTPAGTGGFAAATGYKYKYTYYNSTTTQESVASAAADTGAFSGKATVAIVPTWSGDTGVDQIKIYRTVDGGSAYYLVTTITTPTASYNDNLADGTLITRAAYSATQQSGYVLETYPYPTSAGYNLQAHYVAKPTLLATTPSATTPSIPDDYQWGLVYGAAATGKMKRRLYDEARAFQNKMYEIFEQALTETQDRGTSEFDVPTDTYLPYKW
jgi:hypothetical protein